MSLVSNISGWPQSEGLPHGVGWLAGLVFLAVFGLYGPTLEYGFVQDDDSRVVLNPEVRSLERPGRFLTKGSVQSVWGGRDVEVYRPLTTFSFAVSYAFSGESPRGYHLVNKLFHACNSMQVFLLLTRLLRRTWPALAGALFFGVHPVQTEAVTWIAARANVLMGCLVLGAFLLHLGRREQQGWSRRAYSGGVLACFVGGMLAKEAAVLLPGLLGAYDWLVRDPEDKGTRGGNTIYYVVLVAFAGVFLGIRHHVLGTAAPAETESVVTAVLTSLRGMVDYLVMFVRPMGQSVEHPPVSQVSLFEPSVLLSLTLHAGMVVLMIIWVRRGRVLSVLGIAWVYIALAAGSGMAPGRGLVAERFAYLATAGVGLLFGTLMGSIAGADVGKRWRLVTTTGLGAVVLCGLAACTLWRNADWRDRVSLLESALRTGTVTPGAHLELGVDLMREGRLSEAQGHLEEALAGDPENEGVRHYLAELLIRQKQYPRAGKLLEELLGGPAPRADDLAAMGRVHLVAGETELAVLRLQRAVETEPDNAVLREEFDRTVGAAALLDRAKVEEREERWDQAESLYRQVRQTQPWLRQGHLGLARALFLQKRNGEAAGVLRGWLDVDERCAQCHDDLAWVLGTAEDETVRDLPEAVARAKRAVELEPDRTDYAYSLWRFLMLSGREDEAAKVLLALQKGPGDEKR